MAPLSFIITLTVATSGFAAMVQVQWTTDVYPAPPWYQATFRPDGPWQALGVRVGTPDPEDPGSPGGFYNPMWPTDLPSSAILSDKTGRNYAIENSSTAVRTGRSGTVYSFVDNEKPRKDGEAVMDVVSITAQIFQESASVNTTISVLEKWEYTLPDRPTYPARVGISGLGEASGILQEAHSQGRIASASTSLHMGSASLKQPGSFVLGGYDQSRALGPAGVFNSKPLGKATAFLVDVFLGTQVGKSPLGKAEYEGSIWHGPEEGGEMAHSVRLQGGKIGSALVLFNPAAPYINLPAGTCEDAASRLPVSWGPSIGLYIWNTSDPRYTRIVGSSAYLGFVFSDRTATNVTIKVPFRLLNLTLELPITTQPTPYFPSAFLGQHFDQNLTFLAQAPGPGMGQSLLRELQPNDTTVQTSPIEEFEKSWQASWSVLSEAGDGLDQQDGKDRGLGDGAIAGIVAGVMGAVVRCWAGLRLWRRNKSHYYANLPPGTGDKETHMEIKEVTGSAPSEMEESSNTSEVGDALLHEMGVAQERHEAPQRVFFYEMATEVLSGIETKP
ncbi:hypothetical protein QBC44DRAFT_311602 [Cladorrhinum sp. PSN332]|nr:hypothetical protein QBC44DRAFT_311602 [Cladorrhinum sp. PSN332]